MNKSKLLILDGIGGVPLGREMYDAFCGLPVDAIYFDCAKLPKIAFYGLRSGYAKLINKAKRGEAFYHLPRVDEAYIIELIKREQPTAILVIGFIYKFIDPLLLKSLEQKYNFSLYIYDTDSCNLYAKRREFIFFLENELPIYQEVFSFSEVTTKFFTETKNLNASYLPFGAKPILLSPKANPVNDVLFVGSCDLRRIFMLENIKDKVTIYGDRWTRNFPLISTDLQSKVSDKSVWGQDLHNLFADSKIVLNITRTHFYGAETGVNLRIFEALAAGCFLLTDYCDEMADLFKIGVEIETFNGSRELREKVDYYLAHPEKRLEIAQAGHKKFLEQLTWNSRVRSLAVRIGFIT